MIYCSVGSSFSISLLRLYDYLSALSTAIPSRYADCVYTRHDDQIELDAVRRSHFAACLLGQASFRKCTWIVISTVGARKIATEAPQYNSKAFISLRKQLSWTNSLSPFFTSIESTFSNIANTELQSCLYDKESVISTTLYEKHLLFNLILDYGSPSRFQQLNWSAHKRGKCKLHTLRKHEETDGCQKQFHFHYFQCF